MHLAHYLNGGRKILKIGQKNRLQEKQVEEIKRTTMIHVPRVIEIVYVTGSSI